MNEDRLLWRWLTALTLVGGAMRLALVLVATPLYDESYTHLYLATGSWERVVTDYALPNNHILHTILARAAHLLTGGDLTATRLPALMAGVALIPLTGILALRLTGSRKAAIAAAASVTLWPQMIWFSANARGYTMVALFAVLLALTSNAILVSGHRLRLWLTWSALVVAGAFTIPIFLYPAAGVSVWLIIQAGRRGVLTSHFVLEGAMAAFVAGVFTVVAYTPVLLNNGAEALLSNRFVVGDTWNVWIAEVPIYLADWTQWLLLGLPAGFGFILTAILIIGILFRPPQFEAHLLLATVVIVSVILMAIQRVTPFPRVGLFVIPFLAAAIGASLRFIDRRLGSVIAAVVIALVVGLFSVQLNDTNSVLRRVETAPDINQVIRIAAETYPKGARLVVGRSDIIPYQYASSLQPAVSLDEGQGILIVVNHRLGYELNSLLEESGLEPGSPRIIARLPHTTLYALEEG